MEISANTAEKNAKIYTLYSGSSGNSVFIRSGSSAILIDAGMSARSIEKALNAIGESLASLSAIFVTHDHSDHVRGIEVISKKHHIPVHAPNSCAPYIKCCEDCFFTHPPIFRCDVGGLEISSFVTPHDSHGSVGYTVCGDDISFALATDLGFMTDAVMEQLCGCSHVVLESNHDIPMLLSGPYPPQLKDRILSRYGHLSNDDCADSVAVLARNGAKAILLAHLSGENNRPELAFRSSMAALDSCGVRGVALGVASPDRPTRLL